MHRQFTTQKLHPFHAKVSSLHSAPNQPGNLYDTILPLYLPTKILGLSPYSLINDKLVPCRISGKGAVYSLCVVLFYISFYVYANDEENRVVTSKTSDVTNFLDVFNLYASVTVMTIQVLTSAYQQGKLVTAINTIAEIDGIITRHELRINYYAARKYITGFVFYPITSIALLEWLNCIMFLDEVKVATDLCVTMCIIPLLINAFLEYKFVCLVLLLRQRFRVINEALIPYTRKAFDYSSKMTVEPLSQKPGTRYQGLKETLKMASRAHAELCLVGVLFNKAFSVQILLSIGNAFVGFTAQAYYCCEGFIQMYLGTHDGDKYGLTTTTIWVIVEILILLKLSVVCAVTTDEAKETSSIIHKIKESYNVDIAPEINSFCKQMSHWDFKFTACSLFNIDMSLFYGAVSVATTYLVILIQLEIQMKAGA